MHIDDHEATQTFIMSIYIDTEAVLLKFLFNTWCNTQFKAFFLKINKFKIIWIKTRHLNNKVIKLF